MKKLSAEIPAIFIAFDLLLWDGDPVHERPLEERRAELLKRGEGLLDLSRNDRARRGDGLARPLRGGRAGRGDREAARRSVHARLARGGRQGQGAQDGRLRRDRRALEGAPGEARDAAARPLPRGRRGRLRRLCRDRRAQPRRDRRARAAAARRELRTALLGAEPLGHRTVSRRHRFAASSLPRCATTRCRETAFATARS